MQHTKQYAQSNFNYLLSTNYVLKNMLKHKNFFMHWYLGTKKETISLQ